MFKKNFAYNSWYAIKPNTILVVAKSLFSKKYSQKYPKKKKKKKKGEEIFSRNFLLLATTKGTSYMGLSHWNFIRICRNNKKNGSILSVFFFLSNAIYKI